MPSFSEFFMRRIPSYRQFVCLLLTFFLVIPAYAKIYYSKQEAMELAFGADAKVEMMPLFLSDADVEKTQHLARVKIDSALFTFYVGKQAGKILGYAAIETHKVRTKPQTVLIVLDAQGQLTQVKTLAFHEPPEYEPTQRWYAQMFNLPLDEISFSTKLQGISGATLSSRAAIDSVRKVLAIYQVNIAEKQ